MDEALARERDFHDQLAAEHDYAGVPPRGPDPLEVALFRELGPLEDAHVLELGCGIGDLTLQLASRARAVTALDISAGMVRAAQERVARYSERPDGVSFEVAPAQAVPAADHTFDAVVGKWILHHVDPGELAPELARLLTKDGRGVFIENSGANPVLRFARERITGRFGVRRIGTADEKPLLPEDLEVFRRYFAGVRCTYPQFDFFTLFDRQILRFRHRRLSRLMSALDRLIFRWVPPLRRYSFRVIVELSHPHAAGR